MLLKESQMRQMIQRLLLEGTPKTKDELNDMTLFEIPRLPGGYYTLYKRLKDDTTGKVTDVMKNHARMSSVSAFRKFYKDKFLRIGDQINLNDLADDNIMQPVIINKKNVDVFDERKVLGAVGGGGTKKVAKLSLEEQVKLLPNKAKFDAFIKDSVYLTLHLRGEGGDESKFKDLCDVLNQLLQKLQIDNLKLSSTFSDPLLHDSTYIAKQLMVGFKDMNHYKIFAFCFTEDNKNKLKTSIQKEIEKTIKFDQDRRMSPNFKESIIEILKKIREAKQKTKNDNYVAYFKIDANNHELLNPGFDFVQIYPKTKNYVFGWDMSFAIKELLINLDALANALDPDTFNGQPGKKIMEEGVGNDRLLRGYIKDVLRS